METEQKIEKQTPTFLGETLFLAFLSGLGYIVTYAYEFGKKMYFRIPLDFIEINITQIIFVTSGLVLSIFFFIFFIIYFVGERRKIKDSGLFEAIKCTDRIIVDITKYVNQHISKAPILIGGSLLMYFATFFIGVPASVGYFYPKYIQTGYQMIENPKNNQIYVVLDIYNDYFLISPVDLNRKMITPNFQFIEKKGGIGEALKLISIEIDRSLQVEEPLRR